jgi:hypothetical protein
LEVGKIVRKLVLPERPERRQQDHCGVYRSTIGAAPGSGSTATDCRGGFGYPIVIDPWQRD